MKTGTVILVAVLASTLSVGAGGAGAWWYFNNQGSQASASDAKSVEVDTRAFKYVNLEKIIVMLRNSAGESVPHYLALDVVFKAPIDNEAVTREHLPLLRSVTVQALSSLTVENAGRATIEGLTSDLNKAYTQAYANDRAGRPFTEAMIGKFIIE